MKYFLVCAAEFLSVVIFSLPRFRALNYFKSCYLRIFWRAEVGARVVFYSGVWVFTGRNLVLGDDVDLAAGVLITTDGGVSIGDRTLIGYGTKILSSNHVVPPLPAKIFDAGHEKKPVKIEEDVWIGANCVILPGVHIGRNSIVAAGSVVTKNIPAGVVAAGVPARIIKERK